MPILRITAQWQGFRGAPGYSNFFFAGQAADQEQPAAHALAVRTFLAECAGYMPSSVNINIQPTASNIDETNGQVIGEVGFEAPGSVSGSGGTNYSAASGAVVNWNTTSFANGRRVRGRTFLVPLSSSAYDSQGDLASAPLTGIRNAARDLVASPGPAPLVVWSRPRGGAGGTDHVVTSASVPDLAAILRSRRD
ncbi:MAG: hypothetical protein [Circular genetic element sp.]|nr:MAG: hypothetical protein [Circular genetic element sp.]AXQ65300.1 MAG: hypothetical protein [Circular genetic element sp.]